MATLNREKILAACPKLEEVQLNGKDDYKSISNCLIEANIQPKNTLVWACIELVQGLTQEDADSFFD